jgi:hypothetical protein
VTASAPRQLDVRARLNRPLGCREFKAGFIVQSITSPSSFPIHPNSYSNEMNSVTTTASCLAKARSSRSYWARIAFLKASNSGLGDESAAAIRADRLDFAAGAAEAYLASPRIMA